MTLRITVTLFGVCIMDIGVILTAISSTTTAMESTDATNGCTNSNWTAENWSCYLHVREGINFYQANESCVTLGANLVSISSDEENQFIREFVGDGNLPMWIGLYRTTNEFCSGKDCDNWMWLDGSVVGYSQWSATLGTSGQCVFMAAQGVWGHNIICSTQYGYVCEQKRISPATTLESTMITSTSEISFANPDGCANSSWTAKNRSCYLYMQERIDFNKANENCEILAANLVSISSYEENQFIREFVGDINLPVWIGLYRTTNEVCLGAGCLSWMWLDGSEAGYEQWAIAFATPGQCVSMIAQGAWGHGAPCTTQYGYVCEQKRIFHTTTSEHTTITRTRKMTTFPDPVATMDYPMPNDDSRTYIGVGVSLVILIVSVFIGLGVYYMKTRRGEKRDTQTSSGTSKMWGASIGTGAYDNCNSDTSCGQHSAYENGEQFNTLREREEELHTSIDTEHAEENPAYEEVNNYAEVSTEYTCLRVDSSADTKVESNALYANVEHQ